MLNVVEPTFGEIMAAAHAYGIGAARYEAYADRRWGSGWEINVEGRRTALDELMRYRNDPIGYLDRIDSELKMSCGAQTAKNRP